MVVPEMSEERKRELRRTMDAEQLEKYQQPVDDDTWESWAGYKVPEMRKQLDEIEERIKKQPPGYGPSALPDYAKTLRAAIAIPREKMTNELYFDIRGESHLPAIKWHLKRHGLFEEQESARGESVSVDDDKMVRVRLNKDFVNEYTGVVFGRKGEIVEVKPLTEPKQCADEFFFAVTGKPTEHKFKLQKGGYSVYLKESDYEELKDLHITRAKEMGKPTLREGHEPQRRRKPRGLVDELVK